MDIRVSGHQVDAGAAFREHVQTRLRAIADKYFSRAIGANVTLSPAPHSGFAVDIVMHVMSDLILKGRAEAQDAHAAFDGAADRIDKQLRRYMRRLKDRNGPGNARAVESQTDLDNAAYTIFAAPPEEEADDNPLIIAETRVDIPEATVSDAVMMLDLRNTTALLFKNSKSGVHNMVYRREDGSIGWVEPRV
ncbi:MULTISPECIES: ribosome hibernation-promoting factor, HPF/YfiA family [Sphingosinicellaceae]|uniref:ribosome hibernation-promoting factor, HPF/YfiA family n=1 Tax=Sphingosinicellaceae TaxID=2820280 RepID=UPI001C1E5A79|nr:MULTISPECIES: ribosome-associated translation inhibitor RaiA [Polymorphobacter]QYE35727.1 ribosome-associated translation inhibitor RaiA [Polymorphobacter sp. PAMC 29334]UAJ10906.1 ribosome-associated translation inhibitor RaiA [Polymorphobacter megasporae]